MHMSCGYDDKREVYLYTYDGKICVDIGTGRGLDGLLSIQISKEDLLRLLKSSDDGVRDRLVLYRRRCDED